MKGIYILLFTVCSQAALAQVSFEQLKGKWKEVSRIKAGKGESIEFADSMRIEFMDSGYTMLRFDNGPTLIGESELVKDKLKLKELEYMVKSVEQHQMILSEKGIQHQFSRVTQFIPTPVQKVIPNATQGEVNLEFASVQGKWTCYRKTDPGFNKVKMYIKQLDIKEQLQQGYSAQLSLHNMDTLWYSDVLLTIDGKQFKVKGQDVNMTLTILKADAEELVAVDDKITYYFKRFGKKNTLLD